MGGTTAFGLRPLGCPRGSLLAGAGQEGVSVSVPGAEVQVEWEWVYLAGLFFLRALDQSCII